jgi:arylsulfatase A-like enzyme
VVEPRVSNVDIWPTILDLVGLPPLVNPDGRSLLPLVMATAGAGEADATLVRPTVSELDRRWGDRDGSDPLISVTDGNLRVVWSPNRPERTRVFDIVLDPEERVNLYDPDDPESQRLVELARRHLQQAESPWDTATEEVEIDDLRLNQLRALGYVIR